MRITIIMEGNITVQMKDVNVRQMMSLEKNLLNSDDFLKVSVLEKTHLLQKVI